MIRLGERGKEDMGAFDTAGRTIQRTRPGRAVQGV